MNKFKTIIIVSILLICLAIPAQAQAHGPGYTFNDDIVVTSADGTTIAANVFIPTSDNPNETFPAIIFPNSWALEEHEYILQAINFAEQGYIVFSYSARGWGESGGLINVAGPKDMEDLTANIDWLIANTPVDEANIGMAGISYGAGISLLGAAHDDRVKTVVAMSGWGDVLKALYGAETPRLVWGGLLVGSGYLLGDMDPVTAEHFNNLINHTNVEQTLAWASLRSPITYIDRYNQRQVPIFLAQNFQDELFQPNGSMDFYSQLNYEK